MDENMNQDMKKEENMVNNEATVANENQENVTNAETATTDEKSEKVLEGEVVKDGTKNTDKMSTNDMVMGVLCYIFPFIPYIVEKDNEFIRFHAIQGINVFIYGIVLSIVFSIIGGIFSIVPFLGQIAGLFIGLLQTILSLGILGLTIIGIMNFFNNEKKELPIIEKVKIIKK